MPDHPAALSEVERTESVKLKLRRAESAVEGGHDNPTPNMMSVNIDVLDGGHGK